MTASRRPSRTTPSRSSSGSRKAVRLDIGSGPYPGAKYHGLTGDWTTVDRYDEADVQADMGQLPFDDNSVTEIFCSHALEHVPWTRTQAILAEWARVLRPEGKLTLLVPDLEYCVQEWLRDPGTFRSQAHIFGLQRDDGDLHLAGWNKDTIRSELTAAGFTVESVETIWSHDQNTLKVTAMRPAGVVVVPVEEIQKPDSRPLGDRVLVACPTFSGLSYCLDDYLAAYDAFVWQDKGLFIVDNTRDGGQYASEIAAKVTAGQDRRHIRHVEPASHWEETFKRCWDVILNHAHFNGYKFILSLEQDVIIPPLGLDALLNVAGFTGAPFVTHLYPFHNGRQAMYQGLGCTLMHVDLLDYALNEQYARTPTVEGSIYRAAGRTTNVSLRDLFPIEHRDAPPGFVKPWQYELDGLSESGLIGVEIEKS